MMTYAWDAILAHVAKKVGAEPADLVAPPDPKLGDLAFGCFKIAKEQKKSPADVAKLLAEEISKDTKDHLIASASAAGPYVNITLKPGETIARIVTDVEAKKASFGSSDDGKKRQVLLEYAQPNTHKEFHVGHLRNLVLGNALVRILAKNGWKVVPASYHGDVGAHVAKCLWYLFRKYYFSNSKIDDLTLKGATEILSKIPVELRTGKFLGEIYTAATKSLSEATLVKSINVQGTDNFSIKNTIDKKNYEVSQVLIQLEASHPAWTKLWKETRKWSIAEFKEIFSDLGTKIDRQYFESEVVDDGQKIVDELLKKGIAKKSEGAIIVDLESEKLGVFLIRKSDGTSLYATKDLALAKLKAKEYPDVARSLLLVDNRQSLYFKQLFRTLELMSARGGSALGGGVFPTHEFVGYEFVTLKTGAMSSREGNIVTYESFRDEVVKFARAETIQRHDDWNEGKVEHTAWAIAMAGIKYGMLKPDSDKQIVFDLERALSFDGDTGPYIQYAATRLSAILKKAKWDAKKGMKQGDLTLLVEDSEKHLALQIARFSDAVHRAGLELKPNVVAQWCFAMARAVTDFYRDVKVLDAPEGLKASRLRLVASALSALVIGLDLLGIPLPDEM